MAAAFGPWLDGLGYSSRTKGTYLAYIRRVEAWLTEQSRPPLRHARPADVAAFAEAALPYTYASRNNMRQAVVAYWRFCGRKDVNMRNVRCPKKPRMLCRALLEGGAGLVLDAARRDPEHHAAVCLLYYAALRVSEAAGLRWENIRGGRIRLVGKGRVEADVPMHPKLCEALIALHHEGEYVFSGRYPGTHVHANTIGLWVKQAGLIAGLGPGVTPHILRHTALTNALDGTKDLRAVQEFARHADPRTTSGYTRAGAKRMKEVLKAL